MSTQFIKIEEGKLKGIKLNSLWLRERLSGEDYIDQNNLQRLFLSPGSIFPDSSSFDISLA